MGAFWQLGLLASLMFNLIQSARRRYPVGEAEKETSFV